MKNKSKKPYLLYVADILANLKEAKDNYDEKVIGYRTALLEAKRKKSKAPILLWKLQFKENRDMADAETLKILADAAKNNDFTFFRRLGDVLDKRPIDGHSHKGDKLIEFLLKSVSEKALNI